MCVTLEVQGVLTIWIECSEEASLISISFQKAYKPAFLVRFVVCQSVCLISCIAQTICFSPQQCWAVVPSDRLRITALFSSGFRATVEGLPNVHGSSTTHNSDRATSMDGNCMCCVVKVQSNFHFRSIKSYSVIPLFHYSVFHVLPTPLPSILFGVNSNLPLCSCPPQWQI